MEQLPKIVQARLAKAPPDAHPDANLLAAFGENSLVTCERGEILRHLAVCPACREIVALAVPEEAEAIAMAAAVGASSPRMAAAPAPVTSAPRRGFSLRWGALAACTVIVAGVVLFTRRSEQKTVAMLPQGSITSNSNKEAETRTQEQQLAKMHEQASPLRAASSLQKADARKAPKALAKSRDQLADLSKQEAGNGLGTANVPALPPASETVSVNSESSAVGTLPAAPASKMSEAKIGATPPAVTKPKQPEEKDKKIIAGAEFNKSLGANSTLSADRLSLFVRWTLSDGKLRRSADAGQTWEAVPFDQDGQFRALSVMGGELWVGGAQGILYHSADEGAHWRRVVPSAGKELLTEDVLQLEFSDADHGKLITAQSEWKTNNCGSTWRRKLKKR